MGRDGVAVDAGLAALVAAVAEGRSSVAVSVRAECRRLGVSPSRVYRLAARYRAEGVSGLFPRSRAPLRPSGAMPPAVVEAVLRARKELAEDGADCGAISIRWRLEDTGIVPLPSRATVHRILTRHGMVVPAPKKRPHRAGRSFRAPFPNAMWQLDGFDHVLPDGQTVCVLQLVDDHSRLLLANRAVRSENSRDTVAVFTDAVARYGPPQALLTDNGTAFNGSRRGWSTDLERLARGLGVAPVAASIAHPQTCGKVERLHATTRRWLAPRHGRLTDLTLLQHALDTHADWYNHRRNQAIHGLSPRQAYDLADRVRPDGTPLRPAPQVTQRRVGPRGAVSLDVHEIGLGRRHAGRPATLFRTGDHVTVFVDNTLVRELDLDRTRRYQPQVPSQKS